MALTPVNMEDLHIQLLLGAQSQRCRQSRISKVSTCACCSCCFCCEMRFTAESDGRLMPNFRSTLGVLTSAESRRLLALHWMRRPGGASSPLSAAGLNRSLDCCGDAVPSVSASSGLLADVVRGERTSASARARNRVSQSPYPARYGRGVVAGLRADRMLVGCRKRPSLRGRSQQSG